MSTATYILEKVAPVFNKKGYVGTSLTDITTATGLTKGAIYCNFLHKEDLALKSFELNVAQALLPLFKLIAEQSHSIAKLRTITNYQRNYYPLVKDMGGCPMLRVGVDAKYNNPLLFEAALQLSNRMNKGLVQILKDGITAREIKPYVNAEAYAKIILSSIEGSSLLAFTHQDESYISHTMDFIDQFITEKIQA